MASPFPDVSDNYDADRCCRFGTYGALAFAALAVVGMGIALAAPLRLGVTSSATAAFVVGAGAVELLIALVAAWRFRQHRGLVVGSILLVVFVAEFIGKFFIGFPGVLGIVLNLFVGIGIINGIRGAAAFRSGITDPDALAAQFE